MKFKSLFLTGMLLCSFGAYAQNKVNVASVPVSNDGKIMKTETKSGHVLIHSKTTTSVKKNRDNQEVFESSNDPFFRMTVEDNSGVVYYEEMLDMSVEKKSEDVSKYENDMSGTYQVQKTSLKDAPVLSSELFLMVNKYRHETNEVYINFHPRARILVLPESKISQNNFIPVESQAVVKSF